MIKAGIVFLFHSFISFPTNQVEASTSPKKKAQTITGWSVSNHVIILANENTLTAIPATMEIKKLPLIAFQNAPHFPVKNNFKLFPLMLFIESISSS